MLNRPILEACVETLEQAVLAQEKGADRIELCIKLSVGGLTPPIALVKKIQKEIRIPIMGMARPRAGNFIYSRKELEEIKEAIELFTVLGIKGVVFGFLTNKNEVDIETTTIFTQYAYPLEVTYHKAIDETPDLIDSIIKLKQIPGIQRVLTSGGSPTASEGKDNLINMRQAAGEELSIIAAGKITKDNIEHLHREIKCGEYHGRRIVF